MKKKVRRLELSKETLRSLAMAPGKVVAGLDTYGNLTCLCPSYAAACIEPQSVEVC